MKTDKFPPLFEEGLKHIAALGYQSVYEDMLEEYGEKMKQAFISQMQNKLQAYVSIRAEPALQDMGLTVKIEVDIKGIDLS